MWRVLVGSDTWLSWFQSSYGMGRSSCVNWFYLCLVCVCGKKHVYLRLKFWIIVENKNINFIKFYYSVYSFFIIFVSTKKSLKLTDFYFIFLQRDELTWPSLVLTHTHVKLLSSSAIAYPFFMPIQSSFFFLFCFMGFAKFTFNNFIYTFNLILFLIFILF